MQQIRYLIHTRATCARIILLHSVCVFLHSAAPRAKPQTRAIYGRILHFYVSNILYVVVTGLIGVHSDMHQQACYDYISSTLSPLAYPTDTTILLMTSYLPIKTLVSMQQSTSAHASPT